MKVIGTTLFISDARELDQLPSSTDEMVDIIKQYIKDRSAQGIVPTVIDAEEEVLWIDMAQLVRAQGLSLGDWVAMKAASDFHIHDGLLRMGAAHKPQFTLMQRPHSFAKDYMYELTTEAEAMSSPSYLLLHASSRGTTSPTRP